jgi:hypothetical protein
MQSVPSVAAPLNHLDSSSMTLHILARSSFEETFAPFK